jgi:N-acetylglucosaminyldiphosphoundecaprenol N-acetyl-beta-D-mannosaminyltransferase
MAADDLMRSVYCVLGIPIDVDGMPYVLSEIEAAAASRIPLLISTPNLNWLTNMQSDPDFREALLQSDLCPADGMPIVWIARLLGVPIKERIAGSDIFDALKGTRDAAKPLKVFLFGGSEGVAAAAGRALNAQSSGLYCVGSQNPGFGSVDGMSRDDIIDNINSSNADFLVVSLGLKNGQLWLQRNQHRLLVPVRAQLGAVINFQAGTIRRAPPTVRQLGLEWLWRIKEDPYLFRRYWDDARVLLRILLTRVLPLVAWTWLQRDRLCRGEDLVIREVRDDESITVSLSGPATERHVDKVIPVFRDTLATKKRVVIDFSDTHDIDARFLGLILMMRKKFKSNGARLTFTGLSPRLQRMFRLYCLGFLLSSDPGVRGPRSS